MKNKELVFGFPGNARLIMLLVPEKNETERQFERRCYNEFLKAMREYETPASGARVYMNEI